jgi:hypothetical protein
MLGPAPRDSGRFEGLERIFRNYFFACMGMHDRIATIKGKNKNHE